MALRIPGFPIPDLDPTDERRKRLNANGGCGCPSRCFRRFCPCLCDGRTCSSSTCNCPGTLCSDKPLESEEAPQAALESVPTHAPQEMQIDEERSQPAFAALPPAYDAEQCKPKVNSIMKMIEKMRPSDVAEFLERDAGDALLDHLLLQLEVWEQRREEDNRKERDEELRLTQNAIELTKAGCICGNCVFMGHDFEDNCCMDTECVTNDPYFIRIITNPESLQLQMAARNDLWGARSDATDNVQYRYYSYRSYILWKHGILGEGYRVPLPNCAYRYIRRMFPSETYTHFENKKMLLAVVHRTK